MKKILVILPALNEARTIEKVLISISSLRIPGAVIKCLVVDDGSTDSTADIARSNGAMVISHNRNYGVGAAFQTGVNAAIVNNADIMVNIDSDGQFDPMNIPDIVKPIMEGTADFVTASRFKDGSEIHMPWIKKWGNKRIANIVSYLSKQKIYDVSCGFRSYSRAALLNLTLVGNFTYTHESILTLAFSGYSVKEVSVPVRGTREFGKSRVASSIIRYAFRSSMILLRSYRDYRPIETFGIPGLVFMVSGSFSLIIFIVLSIQTGEWYPKSAAFFSAFCFSVGMLFFLIMLVADMFTRVKVQLNYIVKLVDGKAHLQWHEDTDNKSGE